jgi:hypothetical protein
MLSNRMLGLSRSFRLRPHTLHSYRSHTAGPLLVGHLLPASLTPQTSLLLLLSSRPLSSQAEEVSSNAHKPDLTVTPSIKSSIRSRLLPSSFAETRQTTSSFRKLVALAKPERKPLAQAIGLLLISSSVSMSIPFTMGKLIDFFSSANAVCVLLV